MMVVVVPPGGEHRPGLRQVGEDRLVEAFVPKSGIEALDEAVLLRLAALLTRGVDLQPIAIGGIVAAIAGIGDDAGESVRSRRSGSCKAQALGRLAIQLPQISATAAGAKATIPSRKTRPMTALPVSPTTAAILPLRLIAPR